MGRSETLRGESWDSSGGGENDGRARKEVSQNFEKGSEKIES